MIGSGGMYWRLPDRGERELGPMECAALSGSMSAWSADLESFPDDVPARPRSSPPGRAPAPAAARRYRRVYGPARPGTLPRPAAPRPCPTGRSRPAARPARSPPPCPPPASNDRSGAPIRTRRRLRRPRKLPTRYVSSRPRRCWLNNRIVPGPRTPIVISPQRSAPLIADAGSDRMELDEKHSAHYELRLTTYVTATGGASTRRDVAPPRRQCTHEGTPSPRRQDVRLAGAGPELTLAEPGPGAGVHDLLGLA
jgi:hypothetical protein